VHCGNQNKMDDTETYTGTIHPTPERFIQFILCTKTYMTLYMPDILFHFSVLDRTCKQKSWLKCACFLYKIHVTNVSENYNLHFVFYIIMSGVEISGGSRLLFIQKDSLGSNVDFPPGIIFDVSSGFYFWNVNRTPTWHLSKMFKVAFSDVSIKNIEPTY
jgi:hypothetical protein